jgi:hypothetical protein
MVYTQNTLIDILSKREFIYREFFSSKGLKLNLPKFLLASPTNPIFEEVQSGLGFFDPIIFSTEVSRDLFYQNSNRLNLSLIKDTCILLLTLNNINHPLNLNLLNNNILFYLFGDTQYIKTGSTYNTDIYKNQYRPMKKGVANMIKLHATGAIAMPIEIRLHLLASSKDVIHS